MPKRTRTLIREFFDNYASAAPKGDAKTIAAAYFDHYIEAAPASVTARAVDAEYRRSLGEKAAAMRDQLGLREAGIELLRLNEFAPRHFLVETGWTMRFEPPGRDPVETSFRISYVVRLEKKSPTILLYVSHEDEEAVMKRDGILQGAPA